MLLTLILSLGILANHPASESTGKLLTVEDIAGQGRIRNSLKMYYWQADGTLGEKPFKSSKPSYVLPKSGQEGIVYGQSVSRHEFNGNKGSFLSPDSSKVAVYRKDERAVGFYPLLEIFSRTGGEKKIRYPMCGMDSELLGVCVCDTLGNILSELEVNEFTAERYITNLSWSPDSKYIFAQVLDREQHHCVLNMYDASSGSKVRTILKEENFQWVEPLDPVYFIKDSYEFLYRTDNRDGYRNLYVCDTLGNVRRLTEVNADVEYVANDGTWVYYTSAEVSPIENHLFRIKLKGGKGQRLTKESGWHQVSFNPALTEFLDYYTSFNNPGVLKLKQADGKVLKELSSAPDPLAGYAQCEVTLGTVPSEDGSCENYYRLFKPLNFDPSKKYPLIVYVYGGPHSQMVQDRWLGGIRMWEMLMAQKGYVVYVQDNRGTSRRGAAFEKAINRQCGQVEMRDQMDGIGELLKQPWIDRDRVGIHGWSYGGFMTITMMSSYPEIFKVGVAGGPVIDWKWYEVMYGERYMDSPVTNPEGFGKTSLVSRAKFLKGRLLICQGLHDDTVVPQHSLNFVNECIENGVPLDYFPYTDSEHNMTGKARVHLYDKITDYFLTYLK